MTRTLDNIAKLRDIFITNDTKKLLFNMNLLRATYQDVNRNIERFIRDDKHFVDFTSEDLKEVSEEALIILNNLQKKITASKMQKELLSNESITDITVKQFTQDYADIFALVANLREFHSVICYSACLLKALELQWANGEFENVVIDAIRKALR